MIPRVLPFAAYMGFLALGEGITWLARAVPVLASWGPVADLWLYPVKTAVVLGLLAYFWPRYGELKDRSFSSVGDVLVAVAAGILVYMVWVPFKTRPSLGWCSPGTSRMILCSIRAWSGLSSAQRCSSVNQVLRFPNRLRCCSLDPAWQDWRSGGGVSRTSASFNVLVSKAPFP